MKFLGIPVLFIVAPLSIAIFVALAVISTQYPALVMNGNSANFWWIPARFAGLIVADALLYYIPRFIRARGGINVSFVYKELPPSDAGPAPCTAADRDHIIVDRYGPHRGPGDPR